MGMNAHHLDRMGWIPIDKVFRFGANGKYDQNITLTALSRPFNSGYMMARVPFDSSDVNHYYTVEYRVAEQWDRGMPGGSKVLIHEVVKKVFTKCGSGETSPADYRTYVLTTGTGKPVESLNLNGVRIDVISKDASTGKAVVRIRSTKTLGSDVYGPNTCKSGYVWREADKHDYVCTTPSRRTDVQTENSLAESRRNPNGGAYGYYTCKQGFVWREAWPDDFVCVYPASRTTVQDENAAAYSLLATPSV